MIITLKNDKLTLTVDSLGAQMQSLKSADGCEYLWEADPAYWGKHAPNLFPFIARLEGGKYCFDGKEYSLPTHGFASKFEYEVEKADGNSAVFTLKSNDEIKAMYPFDFIFKVIYTLCGDILEINYRVENRGDKRLPFAVGGHPGFRVPLDEGKSFEDYCLVFDTPCSPDRVGFSEKVLLSGCDTPYPLENGDRISLTHSLFDDDAIILKNMSRGVTLCCEGGAHSLTVRFPDMPYLGFWHKPKTDAPYVCIEPWSSLPGRDSVLEDLACKSDLLVLPAGGVYENRWTITAD